MIRRNICAERVKIDDPDKKTGQLSFVASTDSPDRYGDIVSQNWQLDAYRANPVVLLNHNSLDLPIGKGNVEIVDGQLLIDIDFDLGDPKAAEVARKAKAGYMNAVSVGFNPLEVIARSSLPETHKAHGPKGNYYGESELLEVSIVTIPANSDATGIEARNLGEYGLPGLDVLRSIVAHELERRQFHADVMKHIISVVEEDDRFVISYRKMESSEEVDEGYSPDDTEEDTEDWEEERQLVNLLISHGEGK